MRGCSGSAFYRCRTGAGGRAARTRDRKGRAHSPSEHWGLHCPSRPPRRLLQAVNHALPRTWRAGLGGHSPAPPRLRRPASAAQPRPWPPRPPPPPATPPPKAETSAGRDSGAVPEPPAPAPLSPGPATPDPAPAPPWPAAAGAGVHAQGPASPPPLVPSRPGRARQASKKVPAAPRTPGPVWTPGEEPLRPPRPGRRRQVAQAPAAPLTPRRRGSRARCGPCLTPGTPSRPARDPRAADADRSAPRLRGRGPPSSRRTWGRTHRAHTTRDWVEGATALPRLGLSRGRPSHDGAREARVVDVLPGSHDSPTPSRVQHPVSGSVNTSLASMNPRGTGPPGHAIRSTGIVGSRSP